LSHASECQNGWSVTKMPFGEQETVVLPNRNGSPYPNATTAMEQPQAGAVYAIVVNPDGSQEQVVKPSFSMAELEQEL
jgi:hypothetical protein